MPEALYAMRSIKLGISVCQTMKAQKDAMRYIRVVVTICISIFLLFCSSSLGDEHSVTAILGALDEEVALLEEKVTERKEQKIEGIRFITGEIKGRQIVLARSEVGKVNAVMTATLLIEHFRPSEVIFTGIAGGIDPDLHLGDIVIATKTAQHDFGTLTPKGIRYWGARNPIHGKENPVFFPADTKPLALAEISSNRIKLEKIKIGKIERTPEIKKGVIVTGDVFISSPSKKIELRQGLQADAVEMEGAAVAQICWQQGTPCIVIRSLSDIAGEDAELVYEEFKKIAARNSAKLVVDLVEQLGLEQSLKNQRMERESAEKGTSPKGIPLKPKNR